MTIELEAHPPERRDRSLIVASGCCTCCCCCSCCLHSVGGLVGAAIGSSVSLAKANAAARAAMDPDDRAFANQQVKDRTATIVTFWILTAVVTLLGVLVASLDDLLFGVAILFFALPLCQLLAAALTLPAAISRGRSEVGALGQILALSCGGVVAGLIAMIMGGAVLLVLK